MERKTKVYCPHCLKEIVPETTKCPYCGTAYETETIQLISEMVKLAVEEDIVERRKATRTSRKFKIFYPTPKALFEHYLVNLSEGGIFIPTKEPLEKGAQFTLKVFLPDGGEGIEVLCEVIWSRREEEITPKAKYYPGMGVKFLNLSPENKNRVDKICQQARAELEKLIARRES